MDLEDAQFMEAHLGEEYDALIISIQKFGCLSSCSEVFVEGFFRQCLGRICRRPLCLSRARSRHGRPIKSGRPPRRAWRPPWRGSKAKPFEWHLATAFVVRAEPSIHGKRVEFALVGGN